MWRERRRLLRLVPVDRAPQARCEQRLRVWRGAGQARSCRGLRRRAGPITQVASPDTTGRVCVGVGVGGGGGGTTALRPYPRSREARAPPRHHAHRATALTPPTAATAAATSTQPRGEHGQATDVKHSRLPPPRAPMPKGAGHPREGAVGLAARQQPGLHRAVHGEAVRKGVGREGVRGEASEAAWRRCAGRAGAGGGVVREGSTFDLAAATGPAAASHLPAASPTSARARPP